MHPLPLNTPLSEARIIVSGQMFCSFFAPTNIHEVSHKLEALPDPLGVDRLCNIDNNNNYANN